MTFAIVGCQPVRNVNQNEAWRHTDVQPYKIFTDETTGKDSVWPRSTPVMGHVRHC